jgi:hypothetical protein
VGTTATPLSKVPKPYLRAIEHVDIVSSTKCEVSAASISNLGFSDNKSDILALRNYYDDANAMNRIALHEYFADMHRTTGMVGNGISSIAAAISGLFQRNPRKVLNALALTPTRSLRSLIRDKSKVAADKWLELQFGWMPIYSDIHTLAEFTADQLALPPRVRFNFKGHATATYHGEEINISSRGRTQTYPFDIERTGTITGFISETSRYGSLFELNDAYLQSLQTFSMTNPLKVAWDIVPFSFVVDWIYPVGTYFDSLDAFVGLQHKGSYKTTYLKWDFRTNDRFVSSGDQIEIARSGFRMQRDVLSQPPSAPPPEMRLSNLIDAWRVTTSLALLRQLFN